MADSSSDPSLWSFVGPAAQIGAGLYGSLSSYGAAAGGYNNAAGTIQGGLNTSAGALTPYSKTGSAAESALANLYGLGGQAPNFGAFTSSPGYLFQQQQGENAINRAAAASGNGFSSTTLAQLGNYNSGLASTQYQQYLQNLYGLTQTGASAAGALGSQAITGATALGNAQVGAGVSRGVGSANASGVVATALGKLPWSQLSGLWGGGLNASIGSGAAANGAVGSTLGSVGATTGADSTAIATGNQAWLGAQPAATGAGGPANYFGGVTAGATDAAAAGGLSSFGSGAAANAALADAGFGGATSVAPIATGAAEGGGYVGGGALASSGSSGAAAGSLAGGAVGLGILAAPAIAGMMTQGVQTNAAYAQKLNADLFSNNADNADAAMGELLAAQNDPDNRVTITPAQQQRINDLIGIGPDGKLDRSKGLLNQWRAADPRYQGHRSVTTRKGTQQQ